MQGIRAAYLVNILILLPIAVPTVFGLVRTDQRRFDESAGWRIITGALWTAILVLSVLGLRAPLIYSPVLLLQWIYKSIWLLCYALPRVRNGEENSVPWGIGGSFLAIVLLWPFVIPWGYLLER